MSFSLDEIFCYTGQLIVAAKKKVPKALGVGAAKVEHTAYIEGNTQIGKVDAFSNPTATLMVGREDAIGTSLAVNVKGDQKIEGDGGTSYSLEVTGGKVHFTGDLICDAIGPTSLAARFGVADKKPVKPFDIQHPTKGEGWRLRYVSLEGPESGVYCRGRVKNQKIIKLPEYWKDLVHEDSISVQLQPIGHHQNIIVKRWDSEFIYLQGQGGGPVNCFYHVYAERKDVNPLLTEYEGNSRYDYPDPNFSEKSDIPIEERNYTDPNYKFPRNTYTV
tara:strand:- start:78 stop:902 length:825 start_codon:yes stop_codon:yes gene_type:complete